MKRWLAIAGLLGGLFWLTLRFFPPACAPVTEASEVLCNRLWSPALLGMGLGFSGLFLSVHHSCGRLASASFIALPVGCALMLMGNFGEYWLLSDWPHAGPNGWARALAWITVLLGLLIVTVAAAMAGGFGFKFGYMPPWLSMVLVLLFPLTLIIGFVNIHLSGMPLGVVSAVVGFSGLLPANIKCARPVPRPSAPHSSADEPWPEH